MRFQCSSASRKFLNSVALARRAIATLRFSALQRAENSSMVYEASDPDSVARFSALQRAENSSILFAIFGGVPRVVRFSALQRAENSSIVRARRRRSPVCGSFSALQRAENSSMTYVAARLIALFRFQCSSASRKFLNFLSGSRVA